MKVIFRHRKEREKERILLETRKAFPKIRKSKNKIKRTKAKGVDTK